MSTISVRISLLILATVMFATVWSNDHKPEAARSRTVVGYEFSTLCPEEVIEPVSHKLVQEEVVMQIISEANLLIDPPVVQELETPEPLAAGKPIQIQVSGLDFPLPRNLSTGEYRVIDRFGQMQTLSITSAELISWGIPQESLPQDAYEVRRGDDRWHFIRVEQPADPTPSKAEIAAAWKSVFHFTGRQLSPAIEKTSAPLSRWFGGQLDLAEESREIR